MRVGIAILFGVAQWLRKTISPSENEKTDYRLTFFLSHFRQLGNQKETLMVEIPTVASPSRLFGVLYQQHLSKIF